MSTLTQPTAPVNALADLEAQLRREMYEPGCPAQILEATARHDAHAVARMRCPGCGLRRLEYHPWQRGRAYRVLAGCTHCGAGEEV
jgi:hypothetical protein